MILQRIFALIVLALFSTNVFGAALCVEICDASSEYVKESVGSHLSNDEAKPSCHGSANDSSSQSKNETRSSCPHCQDGFTSHFLANSEQVSLRNHSERSILLLNRIYAGQIIHFLPVEYAVFWQPNYDSARPKDFVARYIRLDSFLI